MSNAQVGAASLDDGQIELMVHRRLVDDDNCGLAQELDETEIVDFHGARHGAGLITRGTNRLTLEPRTTAHRVWRPLADRAYARPLVAFARATRQGSDGAQALSETTPLANFSALLGPLPEHVQILTLQELRPGRLLLRLAHQLAIEEDATLAQVDLATLFDRKMLSVAAATKRSLTNAHSQSELLRRRRRAWSWHTAGEPHAWRQLEYNFSSHATATLGPMEIHTFELELQSGPTLGRAEGSV